MTADTFGTDVKAMAERKWTYKEALDSPVFSLMARQRLKRFAREFMTSSTS
jgi:hypothetical protein